MSARVRLNGSTILSVLYGKLGSMSDTVEEGSPKGVYDGLCCDGAGNPATPTKKGAHARATSWNDVEKGQPRAQAVLMAMQDWLRDSGDARWALLALMAVVVLTILTITEGRTCFMIDQ